MNAYELADYLDCELENAFPHHQETIEMLRQQADRIAELEKDLFMIQRHYDQLDSSLKGIDK